MHANLLSGVEMKAVYFLCCNATVYEKIPFQVVQSL